eukprot:sb/3463648/
MTAAMLDHDVVQLGKPETDLKEGEIVLDSTDKEGEIVLVTTNKESEIVLDNKNKEDEIVLDSKDKKLNESMEEQEAGLAREAVNQLQNAGQDKRYNQLMHLLERSSIYTSFLLQQINSEQPASSQESTGSGSGKAGPGRKRKQGKKKETGKSKRQKINEQGDSAVAMGERDTRQPQLMTGATLRDYQLYGVNWLHTLYDNGMNGILADEMGLGKTIQAIGLISSLYERGVSGPFFVVVPLSTLSNWNREFNRFTPTIPTVLFHGSKPERPKLYKEVRLKEMTVHIYASMSELQEKYYKAIIDRTISEEITNVDREEEEKIYKNSNGLRLKKKVNYDEDVKQDFEKFLDDPTLDKEVEEEEEDPWVTMMGAKKKKGPNAVISALRMRWVQLKKCCNHPYLLKYPCDEEGYAMITDELLKSSGKLLLLDRLLRALFARNHKVLIFSTMTKLLDIVGDYLSLEDIAHSRLDGSMSFADRDENTNTKYIGCQIARPCGARVTKVTRNRAYPWPVAEAFASRLANCLFCYFYIYVWPRRDAYFLLQLSV